MSNKFAEELRYNWSFDRHGPGHSEALCSEGMNHLFITAAARTRWTRRSPTIADATAVQGDVANLRP